MTTFERILGAIYSGIEHPDDWLDAFELLARRTRSRAAGQFVVDGASLVGEQSVGMPEEFLAGFRLRAPADPRLAYAARFPRHSVVADDDEEVRPLIHRAGLHHVKREFDLEYTSATILADRPGVLPVVYLTRSLRQGPLPGESARLLAALAPHFARARRLRAELERALGDATPRIVRPATRQPPVALAPGTLALPRQLRRVLELVAAGLSNREIAERLHLSVHTVRNHLQRLFELAGVHRRTALLRIAALRGWL